MDVGRSDRTPVKHWLLNHALGQVAGTLSTGRVIGGQTSTNQPSGFVPEFAPEFEWVSDVYQQCKAAGVPCYLKANLGLKSPGMKLPHPLPRRRD